MIGRFTHGRNRGRLAKSIERFCHILVVGSALRDRDLALRVKLHLVHRLDVDQ
jgi:hypothetical protein